MLDSGVFVKHPDFEERARWGHSFVERGKKDDSNGHGTHVAGIIGSKTYGVAKKANIIAVRVLGKKGKGSTGSVCSAM